MNTYCEHGVGVLDQCTDCDGGSTRSCNRHWDCAKQDREWLSRHPLERYVPANFHCHDDDCEDCFGQ